MSDPLKKLWVERWTAKPDSLRTGSVTLKARCEACGATEDFPFVVEGWSDEAGTFAFRFAREIARQKGWYYQSNRCLCIACRAVPPLKEKTLRYKCLRCGVEGTVDASYKLKRRRVARPSCKVCGECDELEGDFPTIHYPDKDGAP